MKVKVTVKSGKASGTKLASSQIRVVKTNGRPRMKVRPLYQTKAEIITHIRRGERPETLRPRSPD